MKSSTNHNRPSALVAEWEIARSSRTNLLIEGAAAATRLALTDLLPHLREPLLILEEVSTLSTADQSRLTAWLDDSGRHAQIVSTTAQHLFAHVSAGRFDRSLYYRLNTMRLLV